MKRIPLTTEQRSTVEKALKRARRQLDDINSLLGKVQSERADTLTMIKDMEDWLKNGVPVEPLPLLFK